VGRHGDVESLPGRRGDEVTDVRLRSADLGERDDEEDERSRAIDATQGSRAGSGARTRRCYVRTLRA
jgi:hypothetical protein